MKKCIICSKEFEGWGHNPAPIYTQGHACTDCNINLVIPVRIKKLTKDKITKLREKLEERKEIS